MGRRARPGREGGAPPSPRIRGGEPKGSPGTAGRAPGRALPARAGAGPVGHRAPGGLSTRAARPGDAPALARIYNEGIEDRVATFETRPRTAAEVRAWMTGLRAVVAVVERGRVIAWAAIAPYSARPCYAGVGEVSVYVARDSRGRGAGRLGLGALARAASGAGLHKLVGKVLRENRASRALLKASGFREVGVHRRHGQLGGAWHDVVVVERLLSPP